MPERHRLALITGCSSGLGEALAEQALARGYHVIATARRAESIALQGPHLYKRSLDLSDSQNIQRFAEQLQREFKHIDLLINNAGYGQMGPMLEISPQMLARQFQTNSIAPLELVRASLPSLVNGSTIVNIGSVSASLVTPFAGSYCASKAALHAISDALRMELAPFGIRVMVVRAGAIRSKFANRAESELSSPSNRGPYAALQKIITERARLSQKNASDAGTVAKQILRTCEKTRCPSYLGAAKGHQLLYNLSKLPRRLSDRILMRRFQLHSLRGDELQR